MDTTRSTQTLRRLRTLLSHIDAASMTDIRKRALALMADVSAPIREELVVRVREGSALTSEDFTSNLAIAYATELLGGREPVPARPAREDRPVAPRDLLTEALLAVVDCDLPAYQRALHDLAALADGGWMLVEADLETA